MLDSDRSRKILTRYLDLPRHPRTYADLHDHLLALAEAEKLIIVDEAVNKDTEMHPLVRWQYRGGIEEGARKAFLFTRPVDSQGRAYEFPVLIAGLAGSRDIYRIGFGKPLAEIAAAWVKAIASPKRRRSSTERPARRS